MSVRIPSCIVAAVVLSACGGGGGGAALAPPPPPPPSAQFSVSTNALAFAAAQPTSGVPPAQTVTGTVSGTISGTTLYVLIEPSGNIVDTLSPIVVSGNSGSSDVTMVSPLSLGSGSFNATLTVRACVDDPTCASGQLSGSPQVINVTYTIDSGVQEDAVVPHVVSDGETGSIVIRGEGFTGVTDVMFAADAGTGIDVRSSSEIRLAYPALAPGTYPVSLNGGGVAFSGTLVVVDDQPYPEILLAYPDTPVDIGAVLYDAERQSVLVAERYADPRSMTNSDMNRYLRFTFDGATWSAPDVIAVPWLRDLALSNNGNSLLALAEDQIIEYDAASLAVVASTANSVLGPGGVFMRHFAITNDGHALIGSTVYGSGITDLYLYSLAQRSFSTLNHRAGSVLLGTSEIRGRMFVGIPASSGDGSRVVIVPEEGSPADIAEYDAGNGALSNAPLVFSHDAFDYRPAVDRNGSRIILSDSVVTRVYDDTYSLFCSLPGDTRAYTVNAPGTRAYAINSASVLKTYDLSVDPNGGDCLQVGADIPVVDVGIDPPGLGFPSSNVRMTISPGSNTLFIAGVDGVLITPAPN